MTKLDTNETPPERVTYTVWPTVDSVLKEGSRLLICNVFHTNIRLIMLRLPMAYDYIGYVEGDGAAELRRRNAMHLIIGEVSDISGCAHAKEFVS